MGVDPDRSGTASFQVTFSVVDQRTGRFSLRSPLSVGPRHCGQWSAASGEAPSTRIDTTAGNDIRIQLLRSKRREQRHPGRRSHRVAEDNNPVTRHRSSRRPLPLRP